ncbi:hypothetical protein [Tardiphaga robiniae]|nr:hypothetical protein [Tardiphaga robiniae]
MSLVLPPGGNVIDTQSMLRPGMTGDNARREKPDIPSLNAVCRFLGT